MLGGDVCGDGSSTDSNGGGSTTKVLVVMVVVAVVVVMVQVEVTLLCEDGNFVYSAISNNLSLYCVRMETLSIPP